jgi:hypothetical protein
MRGQIDQIDIDWADAFGWVCPFCGGEIDHLDDEENEDEGYTEDSYTCQDKKGPMCDHAYFVRRYTSNGGDDLCKYILIHVPEEYRTHPDDKE